MSAVVRDWFGAGAGRSAGGVFCSPVVGDGWERKIFEFGGLQGRRYVLLLNDDLLHMEI